MRLWCCVTWKGRPARKQRRANSVCHPARSPAGRRRGKVLLAKRLARAWGCSAVEYPGRLADARGGDGLVNRGHGQELPPGLRRPRAGRRWGNRTACRRNCGRSDESHVPGQTEIDDRRPAGRQRPVRSVRLVSAHVLNAQEPSGRTAERFNAEEHRYKMQPKSRANR